MAVSQHVSVDPLAEAIKRHRQEVARLRQELGDPEEALRALTRELFPDEDALIEAWNEYVIETRLDPQYLIPPRNDQSPSDG